MRKKGGAGGTMQKKGGRRWRHAPNPLSLKTRGGGGAGGGRIQGPGPATPTRGFGMRFGSFGSTLGMGLGKGGSSPCGKQFASRTSRVKHNFPLFASLLFAHTILVLAKAKHIFLVTMTRLFIRATIHAQGFVASHGTLSFCLNHD